MKLGALLGLKGLDSGIWIAKAGQDINTTPSDQLALSLAASTDQIIMVGSASIPSTIPFGFSVAPYVFLWAIGSITTYDGTLQGLIRPYPAYYADRNKTVTATVSASQMVLSGGATSAIYQVFRKGLPL